MDQQLPGQLIARWLDSAEPDARQRLVGCGYDDGKTESDWVVAEVDWPRLVMESADGGIRAVSPAGLIGGFILVPAQRADVIEEIKATPAGRDLALLMAQRRLGQEGCDAALYGPEAVLALESVVIPWRQKRVLPDVGRQIEIYALLREARDHRFGLTLLGEWQAESERRRNGQPDLLARMRLSVLLRDASRHKEALKLTQIAEDIASGAKPRHPGWPMLFCHRAAVLMDLAEMRGTCGLVQQAKTLIDQAFAHGDEELRHAGLRYKALLARCASTGSATPPR